MIRTTCLSALTALCIAHSPLPAVAQVVETVDSVVSVTFLEGWREPDGSHYAGIQIDLAPGWKTYWRTPGDGGIPTRANWSGSDNLAKAQVLWPRPEVFRAYGMRSVGYADRVVLPVHLKAEKTGDIDAHMKLRMGVCKDICLPIEVSLNRTLTSDEVVGMVPIQTSLATVPRHSQSSLSCRLVDFGGEYRLDVSTTLPPLDGKGEAAVVELSDPAVWVSEPKLFRDHDKLTSTVRLIRQHDGALIDLSSVRLTVLTTTTSTEFQGCD